MKGLRIRVGPLKNASIYLKRNSTLYIKSGTSSGDEKQISLSCRNLIRDVKAGDSIAIITSSPFTLGGKTNIMKLHKVGYSRSPILLSGCDALPDNKRDDCLS